MNEYYRKRSSCQNNCGLTTKKKNLSNAFGIKHMWFTSDISWGAGRERRKRQVVTCPGAEPSCRSCLPPRRRWTRSYLSEIMTARINRRGTAFPSPLRGPVYAIKKKINTCSYDDHVVLGRQIVLHGWSLPRRGLPRSRSGESRVREFRRASRRIHGISDGRDVRAGFSSSSSAETRGLKKGGDPAPHATLTHGAVTPDPFFSYGVWQNGQVRRGGRRGEWVRGRRKERGRKRERERSLIWRLARRECRAASRCETWNKWEMSVSTSAIWRGL